MIAKTTHIKDTKKLVGSLPAMRYTEPKYLYIAMANARCPKADLYIKEGDHVNSCQVIGMRHAAFFDQPIHATCSGTYIGLEKHYHRNGKLTDFIKIENDFKDTIDPSVKQRTPEEIAAQTVAMLDSVRSRRGLIVNLGHGIIKETPVENAIKFVKAVRNYR